MKSKLLPLGGKVTLEDALAKAVQDAHTHEAVQANYSLEVEAIEAEVGPQVSRLPTPQGRPRKGQTIEAAEIHALRVKPSIWQAVVAKAKTAGLTPNAAAQLALLEWSKR
jgi:hypothetical protein